MPVIGGFPFVLPDYHSLIVFMPYYDCVDKAVYYQGIGELYFSVPGASAQNFETTLAKWAWLNKLNPDWLNVFPAANFISTGLKNTGTIPINECRGAQIIITQGAEFVDRWWGSAQIGKYAVVAPTFEGQPAMPLQFVNTSDCGVSFNELGCDGLMYTFMPGVVGTIICRSATNNGKERSTVPPVFYIDSQGQTFHGWGTTPQIPSGIDDLSQCP